MLKKIYNKLKILESTTTISLNESSSDQSSTYQTPRKSKFRYAASFVSSPIGRSSSVSIVIPQIVDDVAIPIGAWIQIVLSLLE